MDRHWDNKRKKWFPCETVNQKRPKLSDSNRLKLAKDSHFFFTRGLDSIQCFSIDSLYDYAKKSKILTECWGELTFLGNWFNISINFNLRKNIRYINACYMTYDIFFRCGFCGWCCVCGSARYASRMLIDWISLECNAFWCGSTFAIAISMALLLLLMMWLRLMMIIVINDACPIQTKLITAVYWCGWWRRCMLLRCLLLLFIWRR